MADTKSSTPLSTTRLILIPSLITLGVTGLRLVGELQGWSKTWFNPEPGGEGAIVGIIWLAPVFGIYFALKLRRAGEGPQNLKRALALGFLGAAIVFAGRVLAPPVFHTLGFEGLIVYECGVVLVAAAPQLPAWPRLFKVLTAYAVAARIPVAVLMFFAIRGEWGTHHDVLPPEFPAMSFWPKYFQIAFLPQLIFWVAFTVVVGALFGAVVTAIARRPKPAAQAAA